MCLLSTSLRLLDLIVLPPQPTRFLFCGHGFFNKGASTILLINSRAIPLSGTFDYRSDLREAGYLALSRVFLVVSMRVEDRSQL